jgi:uncharacterized membrane protein SirB2
MELLKDLDLSVIHLHAAILGALLSVFWAVTIREDPANKLVPNFYSASRIVFVTLLGISMLLSVWFSIYTTWVPWVTETLTNVAIDGFLLFSILTVRRRMKRSEGCPYLSGDMKNP